MNDVRGGRLTPSPLPHLADEETDPRGLRCLPRWPPQLDSYPGPLPMAPRRLAREGVDVRGSLPALSAAHPGGGATGSPAPAYRHHGVGHHHQHVVALGADVLRGLPSVATLVARGAPGVRGWRGRSTRCATQLRKEGAQGAVLALLPAPLRLQRPQRHAQLAPLAQREHRARSIECREQRHGSQGSAHPPARAPGASLPVSCHVLSAHLGSGRARPPPARGSLYTPWASRGLVAAPWVTPPFGLTGRAGWGQ